MDHELFLDTKWYLMCHEARYEMTLESMSIQDTDKSGGGCGGGSWIGGWLVKGNVEMGILIDFTGSIWICAGYIVDSYWNR